MELSLRHIRVFHRLLRRPLGVAFYNNVTDTAVKENDNNGLLHSFNKDIRAGGVVPVFRRALLFPKRVALQDEVGIYTYAGLYQSASALSKEIATELSGETEKTIVYMCGNDASHVIVQWAIWMSGNIAVPLSPLHPKDMLKYFVADSGAKLAICSSDYEKMLRPVSLEMSKPLLIATTNKQILAQFYNTDDEILRKGRMDLSDVERSNQWYGNANAMLIYTSGTTSKPKGVVWSHRMLTSQVASLHCAWRYSSADVVLHALPLHHIHGQLNSLNATLAAGGRIRMLSSFVTHKVWSLLLGLGEREEVKVTVMHGVPAMYHKLLSEYELLFQEPRTVDYVRKVLSRLRLMCAGSAPLPETLFNKWLQISGHRLLERYGMSEVGMALSNPYMPVEQRTVSCVGSPLPGVEACVANILEDETIEPLLTVSSRGPDETISLERLGLSTKEDASDSNWAASEITVHRKTDDNVYEGELLLRGPGVFSRYWNRVPQINSPDFTEDGWFRTGDTVSFAKNRFRILGRTSLDIIKTGGYKVSALQVESVILEHPAVEDVAVVGIENEKLGEIVVAFAVVKEKQSLDFDELREFAELKLAPYQCPRAMLKVNELPRNIMGKLNKKEIKKMYSKDLGSMQNRN